MEKRKTKEGQIVREAPSLPPHPRLPLEWTTTTSRALKKKKKSPKRDLLFKYTFVPKYISALVHYISENNCSDPLCELNFP